MGLEYTIYEFEDSERNFEDPLKAVNDLVTAGCEDATEIDRHSVVLLGTEFVITATTVHLLMGTAIRNHSSRDKPYFKTTITYEGELDTNVIERYRIFYQRDPKLCRTSESEL